MPNKSSTDRSVRLGVSPSATAPMGVADVDRVYFCIKDANSVFLLVNENFARLVETTKDALIGTQDTRAAHVAHVAHDKQVMASGQPGHFAPGPKSTETQLNANLPERFQWRLAVYTTNHYLLKAGEVLHLHILNADELWFFHQGSAARLHVFPDSAGYQTIDIGDDLDQSKAAYLAQAQIIDQLDRGG
jgi:hypothetical protein